MTLKFSSYSNSDTNHLEVWLDDDKVADVADFDFTDRGGRVQLASTLQTKADYTPMHFTAKGKSYRFVNVDSEVTVEGGSARVRADGTDTQVKLPPQFYTVDGYAPFAAQMLMLRYWNAHGRPHMLTTVPGLPANDVIVEARGRDTIHAGASTVTLDQYVVDGVVWGRETLWLDDRGGLAAAITRAGGLSFEAVREAAELEGVGQDPDRLGEIRGRACRLVAAQTDERPPFE